MLIPAVVEAAAHGGYILDGFPRTLPTAAAEIGARLDVRCARRSTCTRRSGADAAPAGPRRPGGRTDDTADVIRHRFRVPETTATGGILVEDPTSPRPYR